MTEGVFVIKLENLRREHTNGGERANEVNIAGLIHLDGRVLVPGAVHRMVFAQSLILMR